MLDARVRQNIVEELAFEPGIDASHIEVEVKGGIATLSGTVGSCREKKLAEEAVTRLRGIRGIRQTLKVVPGQADAVSDDLIRQRAEKALRWSGVLKGNSIEISVKDGCVTLVGEAAWRYQKDAAVECVCNLVGVTDVVAAIAIAPQASHGDAKRRMEAALKRDANVEANGIRVSIRDGKVVLSGRVYDWPERRAAERVAWASPGVHTVEDRIVLE